PRSKPAFDGPTFEPMTSAIKFRLISFALAIGVVAGLIAWAAYTTWKEVANLQGFDSAQITSYQVADHLQTTILRLNNILGDYALRTNQAKLEQFWRESNELNNWIETQRRPGSTSAEESNIISKIDTGYDDYLATASNAVAQ